MSIPQTLGGVAPPAAAGREAPVLPERPRSEAAPPAPASSLLRREALVSRLWAAAERQVDEIERRSREASTGATERDAKVLATLCRVVKDLPVDDPRSPLDDPSDDGAPDVDSFRDDIARHLSRLRAERDAAAGAGGPDA